MDTEELLAAFSLRFARGVGDVNASKITEAFGSAHRAISSDPQEWERLGICKLKKAQDILSGLEKDLARKELDFIGKNGIGVSIKTDRSGAYPRRLRQCSDAPYVLFHKGNYRESFAPMIAVVGTRRSTPYGVEVCVAILEELVRFNPVVVSGLAYGIDITAHRKSLDLGLHTLAILGHNMRSIHPQPHLSDARKICDKGALFTEYPSFAKNFAGNFAHRNRIVAGMVDVVLVVESPEKGGALITANLANDYNREVYAIPGRVGDVISRGCNALIEQNKARIFTSVSEMVSVMKWSDALRPIPNVPVSKPQKNKEPPPPSLTKEERIIYDFMVAKASVNLEQLHECLSLPHHKISLCLLQMECKDVLVSLPASRYRLKDK